LGHDRWAQARKPIEVLSRDWSIGLFLAKHQCEALVAGLPAACRAAGDLILLPDPGFVRKSASRAS
jgi:hypothetical protein